MAVLKTALPTTGKGSVLNDLRSFTDPTQPSSFARDGRVHCQIHPKEREKKEKHFLSAKQSLS